MIAYHAVEKPNRTVIPAKAGIYKQLIPLDSRLRENDKELKKAGLSTACICGGGFPSDPAGGNAMSCRDPCGLQFLNHENFYPILWKYFYISKAAFRRALRSIYNQPIMYIILSFWGRVLARTPCTFFASLKKFAHPLHSRLAGFFRGLQNSSAPPDSPACRPITAFVDGHRF
jgi:hypothetical protein